MHIRYNVDEEIGAWLTRRAGEQRMSPHVFARHQLVRIFLNEKEKENGKRS